MIPDKKIAQDYAKAKAAHAKALAQLQQTKEAFLTMLIERRRRGERNMDIAAQLGLAPNFVNKAAVGSEAYRRWLGEQAKAKAAAEDEQHAARIERYRAILQKANAGVDISVLAAEFGLKDRQVQRIVETCQWVLNPDLHKVEELGERPWWDAEERL